MDEVAVSRTATAAATVCGFCLLGLVDTVGSDNGARQAFSVIAYVRRMNGHLGMCGMDRRKFLHITNSHGRYRLGKSARASANWKRWQLLVQKVTSATSNIRRLQKGTVAMESARIRRQDGKESSSKRDCYVSIMARDQARHKQVIFKAPAHPIEE